MNKLFNKNKKILKDKNFRKNFKEKEIMYISLLVLQDCFFTKKLINQKNNNYLKRYSYIKNKCLITGNSKHIFYKFRITRIKLREIILYSNAIGVKKSCW